MPRVSRTRLRSEQEARRVREVPLSPLQSSVEPEREGPRPTEAQLRAFDLECGIEDHGMVDYTVKTEKETYVLRYRVGSYWGKGVSMPPALPHAQGGKR